MGRTQFQKFFVRIFTFSWALAFVGAFALAAVAVFGLTEMIAPSSAWWIFGLGQLAAALFALGAAVVAWGTHSHSVRRMANVPIFGSGLFAFAAASFGALLAVMS